MKKNLPTVSVVITTKNEGNNIKNCLLSIKEQNYKGKIEIIVVDNNSTDNTKEIAKQFTKGVFNFGPERSAQRNYGLNKSSGKYLLYLDADMILSPEVISSSVSKLEKNANIVALYIREIVTGNNFWSQVRRYERSFYDATVIDCVRFIRKDAFVKVKGFDESMTGPEDWDFDKKIRSLGKTALIKNPIFHNEAEFNMKKYLSKKGYYAKSFAIYKQKWGENDPDLKKQFGFCYRYFGVFTENNKWKKILEFPQLFLAMILLRVLVGIVYIIK